MTEMFRNIMEDFEKTANDLLWVSRKINFIKVYNHNRMNMSPKQLRIAVNRSSHLNNILFSISNEANLIKKKEIRKLLEEIGFSYDLAIIRWLGLFLIKMLRKTLSGFYVNEGKLSMIISELGTSPVIFVPTHRSYGDFILMAFICFKYGINIPCVAAGMDFLSMQLMNKVLRKSKAFFMKRKFADDPVYRSVFQEYIRAMISFEESPIEFFIEGTRSRTGKSLPPKFGFLTMVTEAYLNGDIPDLLIVPINISYDRVLEETLFAYELLGIPKPRESTKHLLKALKGLDENYGSIHVNFGDPFSIRSFLDNEINFRYRCQQKESEKIRQIAFKIIDVQQSLHIYGCFNLLALVLYDHIMRTHSYTIALHEAIRNVNELLFLFKHYEANIYIDEDIENSIMDAINVHVTIVHLSSDNMLTLKKPKLKFPVNRDKFHGGCSLSDKIIEEGVPLIMLQIYVNPSLTLFIRSSIILSILNSFSKKEICIDLHYQHYQYVCNIFKHEFVLNGSDLKAFHSSIMKLASLGIIEIQGEIIKLSKCNDLFYFFLNLMKPFLISASEFCNFLTLETVSEKDQQQIIRDAQCYISTKILSGDILDYYCLSLDLLSNMYNSLNDLKIFYRDKRKNKLLIDEKLLKEVAYYLSCLMEEKSMNSPFDIEYNLRSKL